MPYVRGQQIFIDIPLFTFIRTLMSLKYDAPDTRSSVNMTWRCCACICKHLMFTRGVSSRNVADPRRNKWFLFFSTKKIILRKGCTVAKREKSFFLGLICIFIIWHVFEWNVMYLQQHPSSELLLLTITTKPWYMYILMRKMWVKYSYYITWLSIVYSGSNIKLTWAGGSLVSL